MSSRIISAALVALVMLAAPASAQKDDPKSDKVTEAEAVALAFPDCKVERDEAELTVEQQAEIKKRADVSRVPAGVVRYTATQKGKAIGWAYVDSRRVRTHAQTLLVVLDDKGKVRRVEVLQWHEPRQYRPRPEFFAQFAGKGLDKTLELRRGIRPVTGATLSARAAVDAVRTVLAIHEVRSAK